MTVLLNSLQYELTAHEEIKASFIISIRIWFPVVIPPVYMYNVSIKAYLIFPLTVLILIMLLRIINVHRKPSWFLRTFDAILLCMEYSIPCQECLGKKISLMIVSWREAISCANASRGDRTSKPMNSHDNAHMPPITCFKELLARAPPARHHSYYGKGWPRSKLLGCTHWGSSNNYGFRCIIFPA